MKYLQKIVLIALLQFPLLAQKSEQKLDLQFKSISYINESLPMLTVDVISQGLLKLDFVLAYANNYFEQNQPLIDEEKKEHFYIGLNYRF